MNSQLGTEAHCKSRESDIIQTQVYVKEQ